MSETDLPPEDRRYERVLKEFELKLWSEGAVVDENARAVDVSAAGFRAVTRAPVREGQEVQFELILDDGDTVRGGGKVAWSARDAFQFDVYSSGVKITDLSWTDGNKLRGTLYARGYDFVGLARKMFWGFYILVVVLAVQNVLFHQATTRAILWKLVPIALAAGALGASIFWLLG